MFRLDIFVWMLLKAVVQERGEMVKEKREKEKEEGDDDAVVGSYYVRPQLWEGS